MTQRETLEQALAALEAQRQLLGDAVVDASQAALRKQLAELEPAPAEEQRKLVSILFADLVGFTALSEELDPEELRQVQKAYFAAVTAPIKEQSGWIEKYIGDAVLAVFGLPQAQENDPDRAVWAALGMLSALSELNTRLGQETGIRMPAPLQMRIGVNTGLVMVSLKDEGNFVVTGETVNLTSRLQSAAPTQGILITHDTYRHVRGAFDLLPLEPILFKGKTEPVQVYRLLAAKPRSFRTRKRGVEGVETRMVGREGELQTLQNAFFSAVEDDERSMVTIVGEPGMGKSRLLYEFENWLDLRPEPVKLFRGRARQETQRIPYGLLRDLFAFRYGVQDDDSLTEVWRKFEVGIPEFEAGSAGQAETPPAGLARAHFIGELLGYDFSQSPFVQEAKADPRQIHDRALLYLGEYFKAAARKHPVVILLEDLHWADDSSLDFCQRLALALHDQRALLIGAARPALYERRPHWMEGQDFHQRLELHPLSKRDSRRLVEEVLQKVVDLPEALRELVVSNAEGNPFYVEELIKMLIEDGAIVKGEQVWRVSPDRLAEVRVPQTLTGVLQARLDSLPEPERALLQQASVVGRVFWDQLVSFLSQSDETQVEGGVESVLAVLREKEMVYRREFSIFAGAAEHIFKHAVLREVTYETVLKRLRRLYHQRAADWLKQQNSERRGELTGWIADHLEQAGSKAEAVVLLARAGDEAAAKYINPEALQFYSRALALAPDTDLQTRSDLLLKRVKLNGFLGKYADQEKDLAELNRLLEAEGDESWQTARSTIEPVVQLEWSWFTLASGNTSQAEAAGEKAYRLADRQGMLQVAVEAQAVIANSLYRQGKYEAAQARAKQGLELARQVGYFNGQRMLLNTLGMIAQELPDWTAAKTTLQESLAIAISNADRRGESTTRSNLAMLAGRLGNLNEARAEYLAVLKVSRELGERHGEGLTLANLGWLAGLWGDFEAATAYCLETRQIALEIGDPQGELAALVNLSAFLGRQGKYSEALEYARLGLERAQGLQSTPWIAWALTYQGHALYGLGTFPEAEKAYQEALAIRQELGQPSLAAEPLAGLARIAFEAGDLPTASGYIEQILATLDQGGTLDGTDEPLRVLLTCTQVLRLAGDRRAEALLENARQKLEELSKTVPDENARRMLIEKVPWHAEIVALGG
jgi:predicted ATPase/class 3 adenylate cyclase